MGNFFSNWEDVEIVEDPCAGKEGEELEKCKQENEQDPCKGKEGEELEKCKTHSTITSATSNSPKNSPNPTSIEPSEGTTEPISTENTTGPAETTISSANDETTPTESIQPLNSKVAIPNTIASESMTRNRTKGGRRRRRTRKLRKHESS